MTEAALRALEILTVDVNPEHPLAIEERYQDTSVHPITKKCWFRVDHVQCSEHVAIQCLQKFV